MKKLLTGIVAMMALCVGTANAENLDITFEPTQSNDYVELTGHIDYKTGTGDYGDVYPNFKLILKTDNSTNATAPGAGDKLFSKGTVYAEITGPDEFSDKADCSVTLTGFQHESAGLWCKMPKKISNGGTYTLTATVEMKSWEGTEHDATYVFTGTFEVPVKEPKLTFDAKLANTQGDSATIEYNASVVNLDGEVAYKIDLYDNLTQEGEPVQTSTAAQGAFVINAVPETHYDYSVKATVVGGKTTLTDVKNFSWNQTGILPSISYTLEPTKDGANFNYEVSYGDYYTEEEVENVLVYLCEGGQGRDNASFKGEGKSGSINCVFGGENVTVWVKAYLTVKDGDDTKEISVSNFDFTENLKKKERPQVAKLEVGEFTCTGATSGTLPYTITMTDDDYEDVVDHFVVWASRVGDENMNVTVAGKDLTGVLNLTVLPSDATTHIYPKVKIIYIGGGESAAVQTELDVTTVDASAPVIEAPTTVPTPTEPSDNVVSLFTGVYEAATTFFIGQWNQTTVAVEETIDNTPVYKLTNFNYLGWEFTNHINVEDKECNYMHVDYYPVKGTTFGFTPISPDPQQNKEHLYEATSVTPGEWNSFDVPLSYFVDVDMTNLFQVKFDKGNGGEGYLANVYFYKGEGGSSEPITPPVEGFAYYDATFEGTAVVPNVHEKDYGIKFVLLYNEDETITVKAEFTFPDGKPLGITTWCNVYLNEKLFSLTQVTPEIVAYAAEETEVWEGTTTDTYADGSKVTARLHRAFQEGDMNHTLLENVTLVKNNYPTEVKEIEVEAADEAAEPVYFTLQGVRVENPTQGLYIRVRGQKVDKVMIK